MTDILVTGGCGFIGSNFIRYLLGKWAGVRIVNLDRLTYAGKLENLSDVESVYGGTRYFFVQGDICDRSLVDSLFNGLGHGVRHGSPGPTPSVVVNFAAESHVDRSIADSAEFIRTNIMGTGVLLEAWRSWRGDAPSVDGPPKEGGLRPLFLQVSTDEVYGSLGDQGSFSEDSPLCPNSPYAASKASADLLVRSYHETYGLPVVITRCCNNYGPYQFPEKFIPLMIGRALSGGRLPVYGDGSNVREWLHVDDHCSAIALVLQAGQAGRVYNIGSGVERPNLAVAEEIL